MANTDRPSLTVLAGPLAGKKFTIDEDVDNILIGSDASCKFQVDVPGVSPIHARLWVDLDGILVHDTNSPRGLYVNDARVKDKSAVRNGDVLWLGAPGDQDAVMLQFHIPAREFAAPVPAASLPDGAVEGETVMMGAPPAVAPPEGVEAPPAAAPFPAPAAVPAPEVVSEPEISTETEAPATVVISRDEVSAVAPEIARPEDFEIVEEPASPDATVIASPGDFEIKEEPIFYGQEPQPTVVPEKFVVALPPPSGAPVGAGEFEDETVADRSDLASVARAAAPAAVPAAPAAAAPSATAPAAAPPGAPAAPSGHTAAAPPAAPAVAKPPAAKPAAPGRAAPAAAKPAAKGPAARPAAGARPAAATAKPVAAKHAAAAHAPEAEGEAPAGPAAKSKAGLFAGLAVVALVVLAGGGYAVMQMLKPAGPEAPPATEPAVPTTMAAAPVAPAATLAPAPPSTQAEAPVEEEVTIVRSPTPPPPGASPKPGATPTPAAGKTPPPTQVAQGPGAAPPTLPPATAPAAPAPGAQAAALVSRGDAALAANDLEQAQGLFEEALRADPGNAAASAGKARAAAALADLKKTFSAGTTSVKSAKASKKQVTGFESEDVSVAQALDYSGRIEFETSPRNVKPGDNYLVRVYIVNDGKKDFRIATLTVTTTVNGAPSGGPATAPADDLKPKQRVLLQEVGGSWAEGTKSWKLDVTATSAGGDTFRNVLSWR